MSSLFSWLWNEIVVWFIIGISLMKFAQAIRDQKITMAVGAVIVAGLCFYYGENPRQVLEWVSNNIGGRIFGGS